LSSLTGAEKDMDCEKCKYGPRVIWKFKPTNERAAMEIFIDLKIDFRLKLETRHTRVWGNTRSHTLVCKAGTGWNFRANRERADLEKKKEKYVLINEWSLYCVYTTPSYENLLTFDTRSILYLIAMVLNQRLHSLNRWALINLWGWERERRLMIKE